MKWWVPVALSAFGCAMLWIAGPGQGALGSPLFAATLALALRLRAMRRRTR